MPGSSWTDAPWQRVLGIAGGLGPHAHLELERRLLAAIGDAAGDRSYPPWVLSSMPATPDRTAAVLGQGPSPVPWLVSSLERLEAAGADFAVIACVSAHAFLDEVLPRARLPVLDLVAETLLEIHRRGDWLRVGLLATTGTLESGIFAIAAARCAPELRLLSLPDLPGGTSLQEELVMRSIYGPSTDGRRAGGIKAGQDRDPATGRRHADSLRRALGRLAEAGAECVITGCTEIPLALGRDPIQGIPLIDPIDVAARQAIRISRGEQPLPAYPSPPAK